MGISIPKEPLLVSACLLGQACRYDGGHCRHEGVVALAGERRVIPVCPEVLGGLSTPRPPAEIRGGDGRDVLAGKARVVDKTGKELTAEFLAGARAALALAEAGGVKTAILKEGSPSCGARRIYDGTFAGRAKEGQGVAAAMLAEAGLLVMSEESLAE
jgi:uncharacterized protein YbbK (DUF523 family)